MKWKYAKEKPKFTYDEYIQLEKDKPSVLILKSPEIIKKVVEGNYRTIFQATVIDQDGQKTDKMLIIKNYKNVQFLKTKIFKKKEIKLEIIRRYNEDEMEVYYDLTVLR